MSKKPATSLMTVALHNFQAQRGNIVVVQFSGSEYNYMCVMRLRNAIHFHVHPIGICILPAHPVQTLAASLGLYSGPAGTGYGAGTGTAILHTST